LDTGADAATLPPPQHLKKEDSWWLGGLM
jgi:hypothetical protein